MPSNDKTPEQQTVNSSAMTDNNAAHTARAAEMPEWLPQKFWDSKSGEVRLEALVKSYRALEKRLSSPSSPKPSASPSQPSAEASEPADDSDDKKGGRVADDSADKKEGKVSDKELIAEFGSLEKWERLRPQLASWGRRHLAADVYDALSADISGVRLLHRLMMSESGKEPQLAEGGDVPQVLSENRLRRMMQDPRYWRDRDPEFINRVVAGFRQLYDN